MRDQPLLLLLLVLFDVALVLWLALKCMWVRLPPAAPPLLSPPAVATHEAVLIDINNVRGRTHFDIDVDEIVCLETPEPFRAIGLHYADFRQLSDDDVIRLLDAAPDDGGTVNDE